MSKRAKHSSGEAFDPGSIEDDERGVRADSTALSFEASLARLSQIVEKLEDGELALDASLALFEEGVRLARASQARLDLAERRVEQLLALDAEGSPIVKALDPS